MKPNPANGIRSGIYEILCVPTNRRYIGSAVDLGARIRGHRFDLKNNRHHNRFLQRAWIKYGSINFRFRVIERCAAESLLLREQHFLDKNLTAVPRLFNICSVAGSSLGIKRTSLETLAKMSRAQTGKSIPAHVRAKISAKLKIISIGRTLPKWVIDKAALFNRGRPLTALHKAKMSLARKGRTRPAGMMSKLADFNRGKKRSKETIAKMVHEKNRLRQLRLKNVQ